MSNDSYLCNSLYLNKGYQSINLNNDCATLKPDEINSDKHLLHLADPGNKKDFYVCRGIYNYKEGTCTLNSELKELIANNTQASPVVAPVAPPAPTIVCSSSINNIILLVFSSSVINFFILSSNWPLYFVPAISPVISKANTL